MATLPDRSLFYGDNLEILRKYGRDESVDLCYMDPPFNSQRTYNQIYTNSGSDDAAQAQAFIDTWKWNDRARQGHREILSNPKGQFQPQLVQLIRGLHGVLGEGSLFAYLVGMSLRITEVHRVLKPTGSFYIHCDPTASHYIKLVLDSVFCPQGGDFRNEIIWRRSRAHNDKSIRRFGAIHDVILLYSKSGKWTFNPEFLGREADAPKTHDLYVHTDGKLYRKDNCRAPGDRGPKYEWNGHTRHWRFAPEERDRLIAEGRIVYSKNGMPRVLRPVDPTRGSPLQDVWNDIDAPNSGSDESLGYPTQKPIALLERIVKASSNEGEVVLDPCCGCGTTIAAAERLRRKWIGIDITYQSISLILQRLEDQAGEAWPELEKTIALTGIPRDMASAVALAHKKDDRVRKEFEKWAVLTYTNNRAAINEKKGADAGIDGRVYFLTGKTTNATMVLQVKSGIIGRGDVAKLRGDMEREGAAMATLITLAEPTAPMIAEAKAAGLYRHELMGRDYNKIEIVTVQEMIEGHKRLDMPLVKGVKPAPKSTTKPAQQALPGIDAPTIAAPPEPGDLLEHLKADGLAERKPPKRAPGTGKKKKSESEPE